MPPFGTRPDNIKQFITISLFLAGLALLLGLGLWQLDRGRQKSRIQQTVSVKSRAVPLALERRPRSWKELQYSPVKLTGKWLGKPVFKLANRFYRHRPGYDVYSLFQLKLDNSIVAINRGWVERNQTRPPTLQDASGENLSGVVYLPSTGFTLGPATTDSKAAQVELQYLDLDAISGIVGQPVEPAVIILKENSPNSLQYHWQPVVMSPQRHYAYALQWFALAATWIVFGVIWLRRLKQRPARAETHS